MSLTLRAGLIAAIALLAGCEGGRDNRVAAPLPANSADASVLAQPRQAPWSPADGADLIFKAHGLDGADGYQNAIAINGERVHVITETVNHFADYRLSLPVEHLTSGKLEVEFALGQLQGIGPYDEFLLRDVRLELPDGRVLRDARYPADIDLLMRDGPENPNGPTAPIYTAPQQQLEVALDGTEIVTRDFRFQLPVVPDPQQANAANVLAAYAGSADAKPERARALSQETQLENFEAVRLADGVLWETQVPAGFPSQRFELAVPEAQSHIGLGWQGRSARGASLYVWDHDLGRWREVAASAAPAAEQRVHAIVDAASSVRDGVMHVLVQERAFDAALDQSFSLAWITDTQYYLRTLPELYDDMTRWIVRNQDVEDIRYAIHTGDIVEGFNAEEEWIRADAAHRIMDDVGFPNGVLPGNHDNGSGSREDHALYRKYFGAFRYENQPWYGGSQYDNENHYDILRECGSDGSGREDECIDLLVLYLGWVIGDEEYDWAREVIEAHPQHRVILAVHEYLNFDGSYNSTNNRPAQKIWDTLIAPYPNIFMVLCGHVPGVAYNVKRVGDDPAQAQRVVLEVLSDYQFQRLGGLAYMRLIRFDLRGAQVDFDTFSPYLHDYDMEAFPHQEEDFTVPLDTAMHAQAPSRRIATDVLQVWLP